MIHASLLPESYKSPMGNRIVYLSSRSDFKDTISLMSVSWLVKTRGATRYLIGNDLVKKIAFCYVTDLVQGDLDYTSLMKLESIEQPFGLTVERDLYFVQKWMSWMNK